MPSASAKTSKWNPALYKSRICDSVLAGKHCRFGLKCWFAHDQQELRVLSHLDSNPLAKTLSSIEVVQMLPPQSRDHKYAMQYVDGLLNDPQFFTHFTIPYLNSIAFRAAVGDQNVPQFDEKIFMPKQAFMPPPTMQEDYSVPPPLLPMYGNCSIPPKADHSLDCSASSLVTTESPPSSSGQVPKSSSSDISSASWSPCNEDDPESSAVFEPIRQQFEIYCDRYFI